MRLIDADKIDFEKVFIGASDFAKDTREAAQKLIDEQPTAYNVDKVVERLEVNAKYFQSEADELAQVGDWGTATELQGKAAAYRDAAKTVKSGGID